MLKINNILVSQPEPEGKSPYLDIAEKYGVNVTFRPFIRVEGVSAAEFLKQKIDISQYTAIVFVARTGVDHFFRLAKETKVKIVPELKYFCLNTSFAFYIQKYVKYRKRRIFAAESGRVEELFEMLDKYRTEKFLFVLPEILNKETDQLIKNSKLEDYDRAIMYRSVNNTFTKREKFDYDMVIFFSPHGINSLKKSFPKFEQGEMYFGCLGKLTADSVRKAGFRVDLEVPNPKFSSMTLALEDFVQNNQKGSKK